jgi:phosphatidylinositol alpha-1,6-mannosyltransferase
VNSPPGGALAARAMAFAQHLAAEFVVELVWREPARPKAMFEFLQRILRFRPDVLYVVDLGYSAVLPVLLCRALRRRPLVIDTGDALAELFWITGRVGGIGRRAVRGYERVVLRTADHVVVRGSGLKEYLANLGVSRVEVVPDGVDTTVFHPMEVTALRKSLGTENHLSIGVMSSLNWSSRLHWGPGCELIEALALLKDLPVSGLVLGDGPGRRTLEQKAVDQGVNERVRFLGHVTYDALPRYINAIDVCLSTQTNDFVGRARTTGKLPLFLACGRFILASRVGEAARVLPEEMLVDYTEGFDPAYPERLARRIEDLVRRPELLALGRRNRGIAEAEFDYGVLVPRVANVLRSVLSPMGSRR